MVNFLGKNISKFFSIPSPGKTYALPFDFTLERYKNFFFYDQHDVEKYTDLVINFLLFGRHLPVYNSGQYICIMGLCNYFFVPQDLIDKINIYFQRKAFQKNLLLIGF